MLVKGQGCKCGVADQEMTARFVSMGTNTPVDEGSGLPEKQISIPESLVAGVFSAVAGATEFGWRAVNRCRLKPRTGPDRCKPAS